jgi:hypothetical protein
VVIERWLRVVLASGHHCGVRSAEVAMYAIDIFLVMLYYNRVMKTMSRAFTASCEGRLLAVCHYDDTPRVLLNLNVHRSQKCPLPPSHIKYDMAHWGYYCTEPYFFIKMSKASVLGCDIHNYKVDASTSKSTLFNRGKSLKIVVNRKTSMGDPIGARLNKSTVGLYEFYTRKF